MNKLIAFTQRTFKISETAAVMCISTAGLFLVLLAGGVLISVFVYPFEQPLLYGTGLLAGCTLSVAKIILLEKALNKSVDMESKKAQLYSSLQAVTRYGLTIAVFLGVVFFREIIGLVGVIAGVLTLQFSAYITSYMLKKRLH